MKRALKKLLVPMLVLVMLTVALTSTAYARTWGNEDTQFITVTTKGNWLIPGSESVTLKQDKATLTFKSLTGNKTKTKTAYGYYDVTVTPTDGSRPFTKEWDGTSSLKIKLDPDVTYTIKVAFDWQETWLSNGLGKAPWGYSFSHDSGYSWRVSSTYKCDAW